MTAGRKGDEQILSFMSGHGGTAQDPSRVVEVANKIPAVEELLRFQTTADLRDFLNTCDPLCFPLLRWIITSNRTHLELLPQKYVCTESRATTDAPQANETDEYAFPVYFAVSYA